MGNDGSRIQTSLPVDGTRQRKGKNPYAQTERYHEENRRQKRQNGLCWIQQIDRRVEGRTKHLERKTQVRHQSIDRQGRCLHSCRIQRSQTESPHVEWSRNGRCRHEENTVDQETHQPRLQPPGHGCQRTQRVPCLRKSQRRSRKTRIRKTTKRKGENPHAQAERYHEENRRQKRQNGLRWIQQVDRRVEGQAKHLERKTQVRHQGFDG